MVIWRLVSKVLARWSSHRCLGVTQLVASARKLVPLRHSSRRSHGFTLLYTRHILTKLFHSYILKSSCESYMLSPHNARILLVSSVLSSTTPQASTCDGLPHCSSPATNQGQSSRRITSLCVLVASPRKFLEAVPENNRTCLDLKPGGASGPVACEQSHVENLLTRYSESSLTHSFMFDVSFRCEHVLAQKVYLLWSLLSSACSQYVYPFGSYPTHDMLFEVAVAATRK